jgi:hypothetical protein
MTDEYDLLLWKDCLPRQRARLHEAIAADADEISRIDHELAIIHSQKLEESLLQAEIKK